MHVVNTSGSNTAQRSAFLFQHMGRDGAIAYVSVCNKKSSKPSFPQMAS